MKIGDIEQVLKRSSRAVCGPHEREIVVRSENVLATKKLLKSRGFFIVGTSEGIGRTKKIWFNPRVSF